MGSLPLPTPQEALRHLEAWARQHRETPPPEGVPFLIVLQGLYQAVHTTKGSLELCQPPSPETPLAQRLLDRLRSLATGAETLTAAQEGALRRLCAAPGLTLGALDEVIPKACALAGDAAALDEVAQALMGDLKPEPKLDAFARARLREALRRGCQIWVKTEPRALTDLEAQDGELRALLAPLGGFLVLRALRPQNKDGGGADKLSQFLITTMLIAAVPPGAAPPAKASGWKKALQRS